MLRNNSLKIRTCSLYTNLMNLLTRTLLFLITAFTFLYVLNYIQPPNSWPEASANQILIFYIPLLLTITLLINIFINQILKSFVAGLGIIFMITLLGAKQLTPLSSALTFFVAGILFVYTPSIRFIHYRKLRKIAHLQKDKHNEKQEKQQKMLKKF